MALVASPGAAVVAEGRQRQVKVLRQPRTAASLREEVEDLTRRLAQCESRGPTSTAREALGVLPGLLAQNQNLVSLLAWSTPRDYVVRPGFDGGAEGLRTLLIAGTGGRLEPAVRMLVKSRNLSSPS